ncbi:MAG TPA: tryptophan synthase subunit beta [Candidatus Dormibacteraeota bacterium]|nr:tryptophan synthase subunit beta [Candidatus Dormibacteraeota bacterium]
MNPPDPRGYFGAFGGQYIPEVLYQPVRDLEQAVEQAFGDAGFWQEYHAILENYVGRPSPLYHAPRFPVASTPVLFKREDLNHTGAHKVNNAVGQGLLAQRMGMKRLIAETGAGQHGVATATIGAKLGLPVEVYMGELDIERQAMNVATMRLLGATIHPVASGTRTLKDAVNAAIREWASRADDTFYVIGSVVGPHPYPYLVREFQKVIGIETRRQCLEQWGRLPTDVIACVGGGSNAIGIFSGFVDDASVRLWGAEAAGRGSGPGENAASLSYGSIGILHGSKSYLLQDRDGQVVGTHSVSAGLDYPGVGPEHALLKETGRAQYVGVTDNEAVAAFHRCAQREGIVPALESSHALALVDRVAEQSGPEGLLIVNLSGRGEKDISQLLERDRLQRGATLPSDD